ncbi:MAG TPA: SigB/SigF/SigG family RNA polymerase sigma factor [Acidimicrobiales bacterium]|jgi:RNA polymerase sigma-B factor|nr:SigB/SigF/SigG family RNA polymerase sigma factor [Acidimicrobiales bacterium]
MGSATTHDDLNAKFHELRNHGDPRLRRSLVEQSLDLATRVAHRFTERGEDLDDLIQVARLGLVNAVDRFDPSRNVEFSAFAVRTMVGELKRHFRDRGWALRPPRSIQETCLALRHAIATLSQERGRSPTIPELAEEVGVSEEEVLVALEAGRGYRATSLDAPPGGRAGDEAVALSDRLGSEDAGFQVSERRTSLAPAIQALPERQRTILGLRFFEDLPQSEIAARLGISQIHVSRLLTRCIAQLRARVL